MIEYSPFHALLIFLVITSFVLFSKKARVEKPVSLMLFSLCLVFLATLLIFVSYGFSQQAQDYLYYRKFSRLAVVNMAGASLLVLSLKCIWMGRKRNY